MWGLGGSLFTLLFTGAPIGIALAGATCLMVLFDDFLTNTNRHEIVPVVIQDKAEVCGWPFRGLSVLSDSESGKKRLVWIGEEWRAKLKESYDTRNSKIKEICNKHGISPLFMNGRFEAKNVSSYFLTGG